MKNRIFSFLLGVIVGLFLLSICIGIGFMGYLTGIYLISKVEAIVVHKEENRTQIVSIPKDFNLMFETSDDLNMFTKQEVDAEISNKFSRQGQNSLMVEFPASRPSPGIFFDIIGKGYLNWENSKSFSFNVLNNAEAPVTLIVRIKSGENYPKRVFMKNFSLLPSSWTAVNIDRNELKDELDLNKISYLGLFLIDPFTTFKLYFDDMKVNR